MWRRGACVVVFYFIYDISEFIALYKCDAHKQDVSYLRTPATCLIGMNAVMYETNHMLRVVVCVGSYTFKGKYVCRCCVSSWLGCISYSVVYMYMCTKR